MNRFSRTLIILSCFSIAMGYLESAVVVYIREILYPEGFDFPLASFEPDLALTELFREAATLIMLVSAGLLAGRSPAERFAWFLYCFGIWDIFYYAFLVILISWPGSLLSWDILFLIPVTWSGPVIYPLIVSMTMVGFALVITYFSSRRPGTDIAVPEWILLIVGSLVLVAAFTWDYSRFILESGAIPGVLKLTPGELKEIAESYVPGKFNLPLFGLAEVVILGGIFLFLRRNLRADRQSST